MKNKVTVTVGIPAYNEAYNIENLLKQILSQKQDTFKLEKIIVASDGSTDSTILKVLKYKHLGVELIDGKENRGQTHRQNEIINKTSSDILVLLNADLLLNGNYVISHLIAPILKGADLTAQWAKPIPPQTFFESILSAGYALKHYIYVRHKKGKNIYTCVGHMRALSRRFYSNTTFPLVSSGEDQYLYLACIHQGYKYSYVNKDILYFKLPETFGDYVKYAKRIFQTQKKFGDVFDEEFVKKERSIPFKMLLQGFFYTFVKYPFYTIMYIMLHFAVQQWALRQPFHTSHIFETSTSTKRLIANID